MQTTIRISLGLLLAILALNAFGGGYYGLAGARDIPAEWLNGSPFKNYFIPSLFLFIVIGGSALFASIAVFRNTSYAIKASVFCGVTVILWIIIQLIIIGYVSWMQPVTAVTGILILLLSRMQYNFRLKAISQRG